MKKSTIAQFIQMMVPASSAKMNISSLSIQAVVFITQLQIA
jgi:hypothetical protein